MNEYFIALDLYNREQTLCNTQCLPHVKEIYLYFINFYLSILTTTMRT